MQKGSNLLLVGIDVEMVAHFEHLLGQIQVTSIPLNQRSPEVALQSPPQVILMAGDEPNRLREVAQAFKAKFPKAMLFFCASSPVFERPVITSWGFTDVFQFPQDVNLFQAALVEAANRHKTESVQTLRSIQLLDIEIGDTFEFNLNVFLPSNNKYVRILNAGDAVDENRLEKIKTSQLFISSDQLQKFYDYSANRLKKISSSTTLTKEQRKELLGTAVKDLMSGLFSEDHSDEKSVETVMKNCNGIVSAYILNSTDSDWFSRIQQVLLEFGDQYSHSANVSTLAALFSIGLGIGKPEELALAGLLHDIGEVLLPEEVRAKEPEAMTPEQLVQYKRHPELTLDLIKQKKMPIPNAVTKAILQHHEWYNGNGFPKRLFGVEICKEAQLLAIADYFDHMTKPKKGRPPVTPAYAVEMMRVEQLNTPDKKRYDPVLLNSLLALFPQPNVLV